MSEISEVTFQLSRYYAILTFNPHYHGLFLIFPLSCFLEQDKKLEHRAKFRSCQIINFRCLFFLSIFPHFFLIISPKLIKRQLMWLWQTVSLWLSTENSLASNESDKSFVGTLALLALLLPWRDGIGNPTHLPVKANTLRKLIQIWDQRVGGVQLRCPPFTTSKKAKSCFYAVPFNLFFFFKRIHPFFFLRNLTVSHDAEELPCWKTQTA